MANSTTKKKKTSAATGSGNKRKRKQQPTPLSPRQKEIISVAIMALALVLLCCIVLAPDAVAGEDVTALGAVSLIFLGLMRFLAGSAALTLPLCLLLFGITLLIGKNRLQGGLRAVGMLILWSAFLGLFSLSQPVGEFLPYMKAAASGAGGGFVGGLLAFVLQTAFGSAGSLIILLALAIIGLLLFTDTSLVELLRHIGRFIASLFSGSKAQSGSKRKPAATVPKAQTLHTGDDMPYAQRRTPFIISHDDPAPVISEPEIMEDPIPPTPNRFSNEFLPDVNGTTEKPAKGRKAQPKAEPDTNTEPPWDVGHDGHIAPETETAPKTAPKPTPKPKPQPMPSGALESIPQIYNLPPTNLIEAGVKVKNPRLNKAITDSIGLLENTLNNFGVKATVTQVVAGPAVTRYELQPAPGVKVARIVSLSDDIALALAATAVRIEAPIPGKSAIGIEVAREQIDTVYFREVMDSPEFTDSKSKLSFALGKNIAGEPIVGDLAKMPHLLIAGSTGSGKSICVNSILCSILYKAKPDEVKLMLIDPKKVEMAHYNVLPHLVAPVVTDSKKAANALKWVVNEMENRYSLLASASVKDFTSYNAARPEEPLPQIVVVIDELADLMMVARHDVEDAICRIAQMARAAGIHLLVATQRPSVDVITGLIKANIPSRIAFAVSSYTDSRTILDMGGAEKLLGRGDMLYSPIGSNKPMRVQGSFMQETEILKLVEYCAAQAAPRFVEAAVEAASGNVAADSLDDVDELFYEAGSIIITSGQASTSYLQRRLSIGNPRAARLIDQLAEKGVVGGPKGAKPRDILMSMDEFQSVYGEAG